jgi:type VI secretion system protein ImpK
MVNAPIPVTSRLAEVWLPVMALARSSFNDHAMSPADQAAPKLIAALDQASARAHEYGFDTQAVEQSLFAVVSWIDEVAMTTTWSGAHAWRLAPLQRRYFSTTHAGVQFFERLDALDDEATAVREVYAIVLIAGFHGHYGHGREGELSIYRRRLLERVLAERGLTPANAAHPLFPSAIPTEYSKQRYSRRTRPFMAWLLVVGGPLLLLALLYVVLDTSLAIQINSLFRGLAK